MYWKWKSINNHVFYFCGMWWQGLFVLTLFLRRDSRKRAQSCGICCNLLLHISDHIMWQGKHLAAFCTTVCTALANHVLTQMSKCYREIHCRSWSRSHLLFYFFLFFFSWVQRIYHVMICVPTLINHSLQHYSPWRMTLFILILIHTYIRHIVLRAEFSHSSKQWTRHGDGRMSCD